MVNQSEIVSIYESMMDDVLMQESLVGNLKDKFKHVKDEVLTAKIWEQAKKVSKRKTWTSDTVSNEDFKVIENSAKMMREAKTYLSYKIHFEKFCKLCHIPTGSGVVIMEYDLKKGPSPDSNHVYVKWADGKYAMTIPASAVLYHRSTNHSIKELMPVFRGKSARGFLYDTPRVYVTIKANMPKLAADIYKKDGDTTMYIVDQNVYTAYVDPLLRSYSFGAVYVETRTPLKVQKLTPELALKIAERQK